VVERILDHHVANRLGSCRTMSRNDQSRPPHKSTAPSPLAVHRVADVDVVEFVSGFPCAPR
jgi:hypothetical protein